ncbi:O-antigen ligase family protein [Lapidilactobacillus salsurivasis]
MDSKFKTYLKKSILLFVILQPFLDIFWLYQPPIADFLGMSPATIIRLLFIAAIGILYLIASSNKKTNLFLAGYGVLLIVYFVFHQMNASKFTSYSPTNFAYSTMGELFYLVRMVIPIFLIIVTEQTTFSNSQIERVVDWLVGLVAGSIVVSNLLVISLGSYLHQWGKGNLIQQYSHQRITGNIFMWFVPNQSAGTYYGLASKGFFNHANTTGVVLAMLTPLICYYLVKKLNAKNIILVTVQILACFEIGTKVAAYGALATVFIYLGLYLFFALAKHELHFNWKVLMVLGIFLVGSLGLRQFAPGVNRQFSEEEVVEQRKEQKKEKKINWKKELKRLETASKKEKVAFITKHKDSLAVTSDFVFKYYPVKYDPDFWLDVFSWPISQQMNYRLLHKSIWAHVSAINNNPKDKWLGFGYTRLSNLGLIETDFVSHFYSLGILGMLLLVVPYVGCLLYAIIYMLFHFKRTVTLFNTSLVLSIALCLGASLVSGYVMDYLTATIILSFLVGLLFNRIKPTKPKVIYYATN